MLRLVAGKQLPLGALQGTSGRLKKKQLHLGGLPGTDGGSIAWCVSCIGPCGQKGRLFCPSLLCCKDTMQSPLLRWFHMRLSMHFGQMLMSCPQEGNGQPLLRFGGSLKVAAEL